MKHDEECPRPLSEFPCCPEQMCPCDREELEATMLAFEKLEEELDTTMMLFNILKKENERLREALRVIADCIWFEGKCIYGPHVGPREHEIARAALEGK